MQALPRHPDPGRGLTHTRAREDRQDRLITLLDNGQIDQSQSQPPDARHPQTTHERSADNGTCQTCPGTDVSSISRDRTAQLAVRCRIVLLGIKRRRGAPPYPRPSARPPSGRAAWRPVPDGSGTPGRAPHADSAVPTERVGRDCHAAAQMRPYDRPCVAGHRRCLGAIEGPGLRTSAQARRIACKFLCRPSKWALANEGHVSSADRHLRQPTRTEDVNVISFARICYSCRCPCSATHYQDYPTLRVRRGGVFDWLQRSRWWSAPSRS